MKKQSPILWFVLASVPFHSRQVFPGISFTELLLACSFIILVMSFLRSRSFIPPRWYPCVVVLLAWAIIGMCVITNFPTFAFSEQEFWKTFAKLAFYSIGMVLLSSYIEQKESSIINNTVSSVLIINAIIAVYIYSAKLLPISLPYEFFYFGQGPVFPRTVLGGIEYQARGLFIEPAHMGIFQSLGLAFLLFKSHDVNRFNWQHILIMFSILITFSLSGNALLLCILLLFLLRKRESRKRLFSVLRLTLIMAFMAALVSLFFSTAFFSLFREHIFLRTANAFRGQDRASQLRMVGPWDTIKEIVTVSPVFGSGLGNLDVAFDATNYRLVYMTGPGETIEAGCSVANILAYVLGSLGIVGFIIFLFLFKGLLLQNRILGAIFFLSMFAYGEFVGPTFWAYYVMFNIKTSNLVRPSDNKRSRLPCQPLCARNENKQKSFC